MVSKLYSNSNCGMVLEIYFRYVQENLLLILLKCREKTLLYDQMANSSNSIPFHIAQSPSCSSPFPSPVSLTYFIYVLIISLNFYNHLRNLVYDCLRVFLQEEHPYRRETYSFNGKPKRTQRPAIMTPTKWLREYEREKEKEITQMFDSNGEPMFDDPRFLDTYVEKFSIGMKMKYIFYELPYWEHLKISHLLDLMHIFKNVSSSLWRHISSK
jgi:hypothetical protein